MGGTDVDAGSAGLGVRLWWTASGSRNGDNDYLTQTLRGRWAPASWLSVEASLPFIWLSARQETETRIHEFTVMGLGDLSVRAEADLAPLWSGGAEGGGTLHLLAALQLLAPTGRADFSYEDDLLPGVERYFPPEAQLGQGAWKPGLSLTAFRRFGSVVPLGLASYTCGRASTPSGYLLSDTLTLGAGALGLLHPPWDLRLTGMLVGVYNVHNIRHRDEFTRQMSTQYGSVGWLFFATLDVSLRLASWLCIEAGGVLPLGKTLDESPNDLDFLCKAGVRVEF